MFISYHNFLSLQWESLCKSIKFQLDYSFFVCVQCIGWYLGRKQRKRERENQAVTLLLWNQSGPECVVEDFGARVDGGQTNSLRPGEQFETVSGLLLLKWDSPPNCRGNPRQMVDFQWEGCQGQVRWSGRWQAGHQGGEQPVPVGLFSCSFSPTPQGARCLWRGSPCGARRDLIKSPPAISSLSTSSLHASALLDRWHFKMIHYRERELSGQLFADFEDGVLHQGGRAWGGDLFLSWKTIGNTKVS